MSDFIKLHQKHFNFRQFIKQAFKEDIGDGDHTALAIIPKNHKGWMQLRIKEDGIIAGIEAAELIFKLIDRKIKFKRIVKDGDKVKKDQVAFLVNGNTQKLITAERLVLNIMQRMSGIATKTAYLQSLCKGTKAKVIDTRKTTPGFRFFEKWAVVIGGGSNHRYGLFDMILIKDNHIDFAGGINQAIDEANAYLQKKKKKLAIEVETRTLDDVRKVLKHGGIQRIMLDNFTPEETLEAVKLI
ncbi:MAG: carboxylating nicotinate-nucleotide diphosphorylase, partial [Bacteroidia bacterium]